MRSLILVVPLIFATAPCAASSSATNELARQAVSAGGGSVSVSATNALVSAVSEGAASGGASDSAGNRGFSGAMNVFFFPGRVTDFGAPLALVIETSATHRWSAPGYDGALGDLQPGTSYFVRVTSYTVPDSFRFELASVLTSTSGTSPAAQVSTAVANLHQNATWYATLWTVDAAGNASYASNQSTFTTLALRPGLLPQTYVFVQGSTATLNWAAFPAVPPALSSQSAQGYRLEASTTNFGLASPGGVVLSSETFAVAASTLGFGSLDLSSTYYFRVGSLNWQSRPNFQPLERLNFQVAASTGLIDFGQINPMLVDSVVAVTSMVLVNRGNLPMTYRISGGTSTASTPWSLDVSSSVDTAVLQGLWNSAPPLTDSFSTPITVSTRTSGGAGGFYAGNQTGVAVPPGQSRTLWLKFWRPSPTTSVDIQEFALEISPQFP